MNNSWREEEDQDDLEFWNKMKEDYLQQNPTHTLMFDEGLYQSGGLNN